MDLTRAACHYRPAADQAFAAAENKCGFIRQLEFGIEIDLSSAAMDCERVTDHGDPDGMNNFGLCLDFGNDAENDLHRAVDYFRQAARQGHA